MEGVLGGAISTWKGFLGPIKKGGLSKLRCSAQKILPFAYATCEDVLYTGIPKGCYRTLKDVPRM